MRIVDLHNIELLYDFGVDLHFTLFKFWDDCLTEVYSDQVVHDTQGFDFFFGL